MSKVNAIILRDDRKGQSLDQIFQAAYSAARSAVPAHHRVAHLYQSIQRIDDMITEIEEFGQLRSEWFGRAAATVSLLRQAKKLMETQHRTIEAMVNHILGI